MGVRILVVCTGNSCRSQMVEAFLKSFDPTLEVFSAGIAPERELTPLTIEVMREVGIDVTQNSPKSVEFFVNQDFDYVITLSDRANKELPVFYGLIKSRWHLLFDDPAEAVGSYEQRREVYRRVRDEIRFGFESFYRTQILGEQACGCLP